LLLVVGGNAQAIDAARARADELGVVERVLFVGTRTDLPLFFAAADIFVLASAYEANALVVLEALASGLPVVSTAVGYAPEIIVDGENGFLVAREAREIGARFEELAMADLPEWRVRARRSVEHLGWRSIAERYLALVDEIIADRAARGVGA
jgi:UDP-glucose:(heptosyl)LPS alpha-1,3-glucosyltransferase